MNVESPGDGQDVFTLHPKNINEALGWVFTIKSYTLKMAFNKASLRVDVSSIQAFLEIQTPRGPRYKIEFEDDGILSFVICPEKPSLPGIDPVKTTPGKIIRDAAKFYLKNIHRLGATTTYIMALAVLIFALGTLRDWLLRNVEQHHWLSWGSCDVSCAKQAAKIHFSVFLIMFIIVFPIVWAPAFYFFNKKVPRTYHDLKSLQCECWILFLFGIASAVIGLRSDGFEKYGKFAVQHWSGTLTRQPASK
jgi:hypothetical protein